VTCKGSETQVRYRYCPMCATELMPIGDKFVKCPSCGFFHFPKVGACAVGIVYDAHRILLDRRAYDPGRGRWALLGGYLEPGEDPEDALRREVREEAGLEVEVGELLSIAVGGPTCGLVYPARYVSGDLHRSVESAEIAWFGPHEIPWNEMAFPLHKKVLWEWLQTKAPDSLRSQARNGTPAP
jgi:8-oxo-dGTP diphosphatase